MNSAVGARPIQQMHQGTQAAWPRTDRQDHWNTNDQVTALNPASILRLPDHGTNAYTNMASATVKDSRTTSRHMNMMDSTAC